MVDLLEKNRTCFDQYPTNVVKEGYKNYLNMRWWGRRMKWWWQGYATRKLNQQENQDRICEQIKSTRLTRETDR